MGKPIQKTRALRRALVAGCVLGMGGSAMAASPVAGSWTNSYCSQLELAVDDGGSISGVYTSHTGATGSYTVLGSVGTSAGSERSEAPSGVPVALAIQWRATNQPVSKADGTWHWVSNLAGQYHPAQTVAVPGQKSYEIPETLEVLNALIATATVEGFAPVAPVTWPQTLDFHKKAPDYCENRTPPEPVPYQSKATDLVSGGWQAKDGSVLELVADVEKGTVMGTYVATGGTFDIVGVFDNFSESLPNVQVAEQGVSLALDRGWGSFAGGVDLSNPTLLRILSNRLSATTWTDRFTQGEIKFWEFTRVERGER